MFEPPTIQVFSFQISEFQFSNVQLFEPNLLLGRTSFSVNLFLGVYCSSRSGSSSSDEGDRGRNGTKPKRSANSKSYHSRNGRAVSRPRKCTRSFTSKNKPIPFVPRARSCQATIFHVQCFIQRRCVLNVRDVYAILKRPLRGTCNHSPNRF